MSGPPFFSSPQWTGEGVRGRLCGSDVSRFPSQKGLPPRGPPHLGPWLTSLPGGLRCVCVNLGYTGVHVEQGSAVGSG